MNGIMDILTQYFGKIRSRSILNTGSKTVADKLIYNANIPVIRGGCVLKKKVRGEFFYLLGRLEKEGEHDEYRYFKTLGGNIRLSSHYEHPDLSVISGLLRESKEEGFSGRNSILPNTIVPLNVTVSPKGILQFYSGELRNYPRVGFKGEAVFKSRQGNRVVIRWCSINELIDQRLTMEDNTESDFLVWPETIEAIVSSHFFKRSRKALFSGSDMGFADKTGDLEIPLEIRKQLLKDAGFSWVDPAESLKTCSIYYTGLDTFEFIPYVKMFFMTDYFLHEVGIDAEVMKRMDSFDKFKDGRKHWELGVVKEYVKKNYTSILTDELLRHYIVKK